MDNAQQVKPGVKTTEFYLTLIVSAWATLSPAIPGPWGAVIAGVCTGLYTIGRSLAKAGIMKGSVGEYLKAQG